MSSTPVLSVSDLKTRFHTQDGTVHAVNGVTFELRRGELLGVVHCELAGLLDLGGGSGAYSIVAAQRNPGLTAVVLDTVGNCPRK